MRPSGDRLWTLGNSQMAGGAGHGPDDGQPWRGKPVAVRPQHLLRCSRFHGGFLFALRASNVFTKTRAFEADAAMGWWSTITDL